MAHHSMELRETGEKEDALGKDVDTEQLYDEC